MLSTQNEQHQKQLAQLEVWGLIHKINRQISHSLILVQKPEAEAGGKVEQC
jgi:hypothetical protein